MPTETTGRAALLTAKDAAPVEREAQGDAGAVEARRAAGGGASRRGSGASRASQEVEREADRSAPSRPRCRAKRLSAAVRAALRAPGSSRRRARAATASSAFATENRRVACGLHGATDVPDRRSENDGEARLERLEDVVSAALAERPTEEGDVAEAVGRGELTDRVEEEDVRRTGRRRASTAGRRGGRPPRRGGAASSQVSGRRGARRRNGAVRRQGEAPREGEDEVELLLGDRAGARGRAAPRRGRGPRRAKAGSGGSGRSNFMSPADVDPLLGHSDRREAVSVLLRPRRHGGEGRERSAKEAPGGAEAPRRALGEAGAGDEDGEAAAPGGPQEDGPELRLDEDEEARRGGVEEAPHGKGEVEGKGLEAGRRGEVPEPSAREGRRRPGSTR